MISERKSASRTSTNEVSQHVPYVQVKLTVAAIGEVSHGGAYWSAEHEYEFTCFDLRGR